MLSSPPAPPAAWKVPTLPRPAQVTGISAVPGLPWTTSPPSVSTRPHQRPLLRRSPRQPGGDSLGLLPVPGPTGLGHLHVHARVQDTFLRLLPSQQIDRPGTVPDSEPGAPHPVPGPLRRVHTDPLSATSRPALWWVCRDKCTYPREGQTTDWGEDADTPGTGGDPESQRETHTQSHRGQGETRTPGLLYLSIYKLLFVLLERRREERAHQLRPREGTDAQQGEIRAPTGWAGGRLVMQ